MSELDRLAQLVVARSGWLAMYARQWVDDASAQDVVQEALTALLGQRPAPDDPIAWMCRTVRNAAVDQVRSSSRRRQREQIVARGRREEFDPTPDALIDAKSAEAALKQLPPELREVVILRIWGGLGFVQIAQVMHLGISTVHGRYVAALEQMRKTLEQSHAT